MQFEDVMYAAFEDEMKKVAGPSFKALGLVGLGVGGTALAGEAVKRNKAAGIELRRERLQEAQKKLQKQMAFQQAEERFG